MAIIKEPKAFYFDFHFPKEVDKNFKIKLKLYHKTQWIFSWAKVENKIEQLSFKYKHGNWIHEHGKQ